MRDLLILGAGVHAAEMVEIIERINQVKKTWRLLGFLSPDEKMWGEELNGLRVLGPQEKLREHSGADLVPDNSWPWPFSVPRERLVTIVDPSTFVSRTATIGVGGVFYPHCYVGLKARVGDGVFALSGSVINHDDVVEDHCVLASQATLAGSVHVEPECYLGQSCTVRQYLRIGRKSMIGMGAVVVKDVPPGSTMAGNPARALAKEKK
jgi:bifunctional N-acetylglucosamine-1-phosphate-uridyltransferase/glucosamine-1-phosphate-acetyltransferase GlmU-like protein